MPASSTSTSRIAIPDHGDVTVKVDSPRGAHPETPIVILAHGANNDLDFPLLAYLADHLAGLGCASVVRFNFPYVERGSSSPDSRPVLESTFLHVYKHVTKGLPAPSAPVFVGGKSLGGRTAAELVSRRTEGGGVAASGLIELGYPLHAAGKKERLFLEPLRHIDVPSLFFVGTRDPLCDPALLQPILAGLIQPGNLRVVEGGDHSLHLPRSSTRQPDDSYPDVARAVTDFVTSG